MNKIFYLFSMLIALLFIIPLVLSTISPLGFRLLGNNWPKVVGVFVLVLVAILISLLEAASMGTPQTLDFEWIPQLGLNVSVRADSFGLLMALIITVIGSGVFFYSSGYLANDPRTGTIIGWLLLFMSAMLGVALADNIVLFFICWEMTSISSYILIGTNHDNAKARTGAKTALLVTTVGGLALLGAMALLGIATGVWNLSELPPIHNHPWATAIFILICLAAFTKSAQWPFSFWLPNAMAAPTPISAYLHSATMVKAGVFLLARMHPVLSNHFAWMPTLVIVSSITMLMVTLAIPKATDLKALLANSTIGALALLVCMIGIGTPYALNAMLLFLLAHACYKGPLFLVAGSIDHAVQSRDINSLGGLAKKMPWTTLTGCIAGVSMVGVPPLLGFAAKEMLLEAGLSYSVWLLGIIAFLVVGFVMVACCVVLIPAFGKNHVCVNKAHESPWTMVIPMLTISIFGLVGGLGVSRLEQYLVAPAAAAIGVSAEKLGLWHGFNIYLAISIFALFIGIIAFNQRHFLFSIVPCLSKGLKVHDAIWTGIMYFAKTLTRLVQNGSLTLYLGTIIVVTCALMFYAWSKVHAPMNISIVQNVTLAELSAGFLIMAGSIATAFARRRLPAIAGLGSVGIGMTFFFYCFSSTRFSNDTIFS